MLRGGPARSFGRVFGFYVGAMLAHFSLLGASWVHFSRLAALVVAFPVFLGVLECSGHDFGASWAQFSWFLGPLKPHFPKPFCRICVLAQVH